MTLLSREKLLRYLEEEEYLDEIELLSVSKILRNLP